MLSLSETQFISNSIKHHIRLDSRNFSQIRNQSIEIPSFISLIADKTVRILRGNSCIEISIIFKSKNDENENLFINENPFIKNNHPCISILKEKLKSINSILCFIKIDVIKDDGNINDMFFDGMNVLFDSIDGESDFKYDDKSDFKYDFKYDSESDFKYDDKYDDKYDFKYDFKYDDKYDFKYDRNNINQYSNQYPNQCWCPRNFSYAVFENEIIADPTKLEEESCDGIIRFIENGGILIEGRLKIENIKDILKNKFC